MKQIVGLAAATVLLFLILVLPNHPEALHWFTLSQLPLELPVLIFGLLAIGRVFGLPALLALILVITILIKFSDIAMFMAYNRPFNPILDLFLIRNGIGFLANNFGRPMAYLGIGAMVAIAVFLYAALLHSFRLWGNVSLSGTGRITAFLIALGFTGLCVADARNHNAETHFKSNSFVTALTSRVTYNKVIEIQHTRADLLAFTRSAKTDPYNNTQGLFDRIGARDVIFIYIESYGRTSFENPLYTNTHLSTLRAHEKLLRNQGFDIRSGWLTAPTEGGQSWLAHGALGSGLWTSDNGRYHAMLSSGRKWLFHLAADAGYRTAAVMPAITRAWPESSAMGFDVIMAAADIPYAGERFNWVTVPDQFTLANYDDLLGRDSRNDFMQIVLISSHAPWVPLPQMLPWDALGDGTVFNQWATQGPTPGELWKDHDKVREQYRMAIDYSLQATLSHVARLGDEAPLVVITGDHPPAGFVSQIDSHDVPIHMIGPADVLASIEGWGWSDGLVPAADAPVWRMDAFRNRFIDAFTSPDKLVHLN